MSEYTIDPERLRRVEQADLLIGTHAEPQDGDALRACIMEATAYVVGEPWGDYPACACPVVSSLMRFCNDRMDHRPRQYLKRYIPRLVGSRAIPDVTRRRMWMVADFAVRVALPRALDALGSPAFASVIRALPETTDETARANHEALAEVSCKLGSADYCCFYNAKIAITAAEQSEANAVVKALMNCTSSYQLVLDLIDRLLEVR